MSAEKMANTVVLEEQSEEIKHLNDYLNDVISKAQKALSELEPYTQEQVDALTKACAKAVYENAEELARDAVEETDMGSYEDKVAKNRNKSKLIWWSLREKKSVGIIEREADTGIVKVAKPVGIVAAITPMTNPIVTPMSNAMFALKGRNPIIIAPHPKAMACGIKTVKYMNEALKELGAPENIIQILDIPSMTLTQMLMRRAHKVIATGGMAMVRSVYSSGKPALGVGAGNVQCIVDRGVDYEEAVRMVIAGRSFDNGIVCTSEQSAILPKEDYEAIMSLFEKHGAYLVPDDQCYQLRNTLFQNGEMARALIGKDVQTIAAAAGLNLPGDTKILLVKAQSMDDILGSEKMFPVLTAYAYDDWEDAIEIARLNLEKIGKGHSICIHSYNREHIEQAALHTEVSRVVVNQSCASSGGGSWANGLSPTNTLGCGTWGGNSISDNLTYSHLLNISRIANVLEDRKAPSDNKIWA